MSDRPRRVATCLAAWAAAAAGMTPAGAAAAGADPVGAQLPEMRLAPVPEVRALGRRLFVLEEAISFHCHEPARHQLVCDSESELTVLNPTGNPVALTLEVDPRASQLDLGGASLDLTDRAGRQVKTATAEFPPGSSQLRLTIPRAYHHDARAEGDMFMPVILGRHPLLGQHAGKPFTAEITLQSVKKYRRWGRVDKTRVVLRYPGGWRWRASAESRTPPPPCPTSGSPPSGLTGCRRDGPDGDQEVSWAFSANDDTSFARSVALTPPADVFFNGGPLLGVAMAGGTECWDCPQAFRVWAGYEIGLTAWTLLALLAEYSPTDRFALVPTFEIALVPPLRAIPAISAGLGVPVRLTPEADVGFRFQISAAWPLASTVSIGVVALCDLFPFIGDDWHPLFGGGIQLGL